MARGPSRFVLVLAGWAGVLAFAIEAVQAQDGPAPDPALVARGEYLARAGDCAACHTAPEEGSAPYAGGYAISSPMGSIVSSNITASKTHGIGSYSLEEFSRALRDGVLPDGTHLYPAMPYTAYRGVTDEDVAALYAYFMLGVMPVEASPPRTELPFPFSIRALMIGWNFLFARGEAFTPAPGASAEAQRGQCLVETLGHCGTCHTPRNVLMGEKPSRFLAGGEVGGWHAPNITSDPVAGIGAWSEEEIVTYLKNGAVPGKGDAAGGMAEAVEHSLRYLVENDLQAIAAYLKTVSSIAEPGALRPPFDWSEPRPAAATGFEPGNGPAQADLAQASTLDGAILYNGACASCHGIAGAGTADNFYPSLTQSTTVGSTNPANLVMTIVEGVDRKGASAHAFMPAFGEELTNAQIAAVASYIAGRFGNPDVSVDEATVMELRAGGPTPLIVRAVPYLTAAGILVLAATAILFARRKRFAHV
jgi:mono/diheme cytochrome c family protein